MSPRLALLNLVLLAVAVFFGLELMGELSAARPLPDRPVGRAVAQGPPGDAVAGDVAVRPDARGQFGNIASKNLFSPNRTDVVATPPETAGPRAAPRPILHGVLLDDGKSRAYLEEPATKRVFGYAVGDTVGGGKLEAIRADRVMIARPEGPVEVMLRDPSKPSPPAMGAEAPGAGAPFPAIRPGSGMPAILPTTPAVSPPAQPLTAPPRPLQSIPSDFLRRPTVPPSEPSSR